MPTPTPRIEVLRRRGLSWSQGRIAESSLQIETVQAILRADAGIPSQSGDATEQARLAAAKANKIRALRQSPRATACWQL